MSATRDEDDIRGFADDQAKGTKPNRDLDLLMKIGAMADAFHDPKGNAYVVIPVDGHHETHLVKSRHVRLWLGHEFRRATGRMPSDKYVADVLRDLEARAVYDGPERKLHLRYARVDDAIFVDLGDPSWTVFKVTADGWSAVTDAPVYFYRPAGMAPLPMPERGGNVEELKPLLNVDQEGFVLTVAFILGAMRGEGPFTVGAVSGAYGTAKTTFCGLVRTVFDPNALAVRGPIKDERDLYVAAHNSHALVFDNMSGLPVLLSDALCRLATGGGFSCRALYTDAEETVFEGMRVVILNGIDDVVERPDLADRSIFFFLERIGQAERKLEKEVWADFHRVHPRVLGALFDALATGLRNVTTMTMEALPRMADFALWVSACEPALGWEKGTFMRVYDEMLRSAQEELVCSDPVAKVILKLMDEQVIREGKKTLPGRNEWRGTREELLGVLNERASDDDKRTRRWPTSGKGMGNRLVGLTHGLRLVGFEVVCRDKSNGSRKVEIHRAKPFPEQLELDTVVPFRPKDAEMMAYPEDDVLDGRL